MIRVLGLALGVIAAAGCTLLQQAHQQPDRGREGVLETTLDNGLKVVLVEDRSAPVVALNVWVRTGSADELKDEAGMAHVFEHMLFKGTERREVGEIATTVEAAGGNINAFTSFDMTVYHITMASKDVAVGIDVLADAILHSTFDAAELDKEKQVILEEIRRGEDSPGRVMFQTIFDLVYQKHPYRHPVIGTQESVLSVSRDDMLDFHHRWYVPNNMTFVIAGDFDPDAALAQITEAFADAAPRPDLAHPRVPEPTQTAPRAEIARRDFQQSQLGVAWPVPAFQHEDTAYLDLLAMVLGAGDSSRLYRNVKDRERLVHTIGASAYTPLDPGVFYVNAALDPEQIEPALTAISTEVSRIRNAPPTSAELERARVNLLSGEVHEKETMQGQARKMGYYYTLAGGLDAEEVYLDRIRSATPEDLQRVARTYLRPDRVNVALLVRDDERTELDDQKLLAAVAAGETRGVVANGTEVGEGILRYTLDNGLRVLVRPNDRVPLVAIRVAFLGGQLAEDEESQGISSFLGEMLEKGTDTRSAAQLAAEVEGIAADLGGFSGRNSFGISASFLTEYLDPGLDLLADTLLHPAFPEEEIAKLKEERIAAIERREDNLASKAFDLFAETLYVGHPYRFPTIGTKESVQRIERAALFDYYRRLAVPSNGVMAIVGDVDPDAVVEALAARLADWKGPGSVTLPKRPDVAQPESQREASIEKHKAQVHVVIGFPGLSVGDPDAPNLDVLTQILSGQGGRLFLELRDKRSLAYSVSAFAIEGVDPGSFGVYIASAPDKLDDSVAGLNEELRRIRDEPIEPAELERAKGYLIGSQAVSLQRFGAQAMLLALDELYGLGPTHHLQYGDRIQKVTVEDVRKVADRLINIDAPVIAVVK